MQQSAHQPAPCRTIVTHDAHQLAGNLSRWERHYEQISTGRFVGALAELNGERWQVFQETISQAVRQSCRVWPGALWFGFLVRGDGSRLNGRPVAENAVLVRPGGQEFELMTPRAHAMLSVVMCGQLLADAAREAGVALDVNAIGRAELLDGDGAARAQCMDAIAGLLAPQDAALASPHGSLSRLGQHGPPDFTQRQAALTAALLSMLGKSGAQDRPSCHLQRRRHIVRQARDYMLAQRAQPISVPQLCAQVHVSRRTLQYCFEDVLGVSPMLYLRALRLNGVRRQLLEPVGGRISIGQVAADWGFSSFSQFSCDYRKLFGESASTSVTGRALSA
ncbi:MAG: helix-turn-helix domain-containing protein [Pseudomonadota bacterium]